jgi:putative spermidine/putrescine transport system ATP-binding protein
MQEHETLKIEGLRKRIGTVELKLDLEVPPGARLVITGSSGSGKTTFLRILAGLDSLDSGQIWLGNRNITQLPVHQRDIGYIFQEAALFESMNVIENAAFGLRMRGMAKTARRGVVIPWLERVGLASLAERSVHRLSGGERQRVAFVRALAWKPKLLLLDEPFSAMDPALRGVLRDELLALHRDWPVPLIFVTHDPEDAKVLATSQYSFQNTP